MDSRGLFYPGSPAAKVLLFSLPVVGWAAWAYLLTGGNIESNTFLVLFLVGLCIYKCPLETAAKLPRWTPTVLLLAAMFLPLGLVILDLDLGLAPDSDTVLVVGFVVMAAGLHMRIKVARQADRA